MKAFYIKGFTPKIDAIPSEGTYVGTILLFGIEEYDLTAKLLFIKLLFIKLLEVLNKLLFVNKLLLNGNGWQGQQVIMV